MEVIPSELCAEVKQWNRFLTCFSVCVLMLCIFCERERNCSKLFDYGHFGFLRLMAYGCHL